MSHPTLLRATVALSLACGIALWVTTAYHLEDVSVLYRAYEREIAAHPQLLDRDNQPLNYSYQNTWNFHARHRLEEIPAFLQQVFVQAEDQRFWQHAGVDWLARFQALQQNLRNRRVVRGASTITEQVVRLLNPRPRTLWSRWLEGWEARQLERELSKQEILAFYLNQVPYASNRRGVAQAARFYFDRSVYTLSQAEALALAVLVRSPSRLDPYRNSQAPLLASMHRLATRMGVAFEQHPLMLVSARPAPPTQHFARFVLPQIQQRSTQQTTLDSGLQDELQGLLDQRLTQLQHYDVENGGLVVVDHTTGAIRAWVVAGANDAEYPGHHIDTVLTRRQPGSTLKPFLYAAALETGWTLSTRVHDGPTVAAIGHGLHQYQNYSRRHYGDVTVFEALGNSLNIPAIQTIRRVGVGSFLVDLHQLGFRSLAKRPDHYGDGLALGNGEVSLLELANAYATLANLGTRTPTTAFARDAAEPRVRIYSKQVAQQITHTLSTPAARTLEFGHHSVLNTPYSAAFKTGTSTDHRDTWTIAYDSRHVVGVWMGNLDRRTTRGLTGATGPALVARATLARLQRDRVQRPDWEWLQPKNESPTEASLGLAGTFRVTQPSDGLRLAIDPRVPSHLQSFRFVAENVASDRSLEWTLNDKTLTSRRSEFDWQLETGTHTLTVSDGFHTIGPIAFEVR